MTISLKSIVARIEKMLSENAHMKHFSFVVFEKICRGNYLGETLTLIRLNPDLVSNIFLMILPFFEEKLFPLYPNMTTHMQG